MHRPIARLITTTLPATLALLFFISLCTPRVARANSFTLPLQGYYHPGRALAVRWNISDPISAVAQPTIDLHADGAIHTRIEDAAISSRILPWLTWAEVRYTSTKLLGKSFDLPTLHPLSPDQRLIAFDPAAQIKIAEAADSRSVLVPIDPADLAQSDPRCWTSIDRLILSRDHWSQIPSRVRIGLIALGIQLCVVSDLPPEGLLPWTKSSQGWELPVIPRIPPLVASQLGEVSADFSPGLSFQIRQRIIALVLMVSFVLAGLLLWRSRWMSVALGILSAASVVALAGLLASMDTTHRIQQAVAFHQSEMDWVDQWSIVGASRATDTPIPRATLPGLALPIFTNCADESSPPSDFSPTSALIRCDSSGNLADIVAPLPSGTVLAVMQRQLQTAATQPAAR